MATSNQSKVVHSQSRQIIYNVYKFMTREKEEGEVVVPLNRVLERVAEATGVSISTIKRITKEGNSQEQEKKFSSPRKKIRKPKPKSSVDQFDEEIIRNVMYNYTAINKRRPTMKAIFQAVKDDGVNFTGKITSFRKVVKKLGFRWKKTQDNRKILCEKTDIRTKRIDFLTKLKKYKRENRNIVYTDETYLHSSHTVPLAWDDGTTKCLKAPVAKGRRLIIVHCGGKNGFVPNGLLMFKSGLKTGDYYDDMNHKNYMKWVKEKLIPNLQPNSVVVIDNASYHNVQVDPSPTSNSKKSDMQQWLRERNIFFEMQETKPVLYGKIKIHKPVHEAYALDKLLAEHGHSVLRLPPYHPELNPIEKIWALVKCHVASHNVTFKLEDVQKIAEEKFQSVGVEEWEKICAHVEKIEEQYMEREYITDDFEEITLMIQTYHLMTAQMKRIRM